MEAILFIGIPAAGKSTFYKTNFFRTHVRINLDMLKTRPRERILFQACIDAKQRFVVDNTNPTRMDRQRYIEPAAKKGFKIIGYFFNSDFDEAVERNQKRPEGEKIPEAGIRRAYSNLELPDYSEGFDELYHVRINDHGGFDVFAWNKTEKTG
jgi:predicted kinase